LLYNGALKIPDNDNDDDDDDDDDNADVEFIHKINAINQPVQTLVYQIPWMTIPN